MKKDKFEWQEATSAPAGYPIEVYLGGLKSENGNFTSLYGGITLGAWGEPSYGMSRGLKTIPNHLHVIWLSYFEHKFYEIDTPIDYEKMVSLFNEGFYKPSDGDDPRPRKEEYNTIIVGFAPGGVVVVWVKGIGRQVEIGRYQGREKIFTQEHIEELSPGPHKNMHSLEYQNNTLYNWNMIPEEIVKKVKDKPIPYGLWDTYRKKYNWQLIFESLNSMKTRKIMYSFYNGEKERLFGDTEIETYPEIPEAFRWTTPKKRAIPKSVGFRWIDSGDIYGGIIKFDEQEIFKAFEEIYGTNPDTKAELLIYINYNRDYATVALKSKEKEVALFNNKISISKW